MNTSHAGPGRAGGSLLYGSIAVVTVGLAIAVRLAAPGWMLLIFGLPLLIMGIVHIIVHAIAGAKATSHNRRFRLLLLLSDLDLFLGFALQADAGDAPGTYVGLVSVFKRLFLPGADYAINDSGYLSSILTIGSFLLLVLAG